MQRMKLALFAAVLSPVAFAEISQTSDTRALPPDAAHAVATRRHEGIPSLAVSTKNGRRWATWYGGPTAGEDSNNYVILATSAADGATWKEVLVADPDGAGPVRAFDPEIWYAPDGKLRWTWTERVAPLAAESKNKYAGCAADPKHDRLMMVELDAENEPDAASLAAPRQIARGVMMCKPIVRRDGAWLFPVAHWFESPSACVYATTDAGKTFVELGGVTLPEDRRTFDEHCLVELGDGTLRAYVRTLQKEPDKNGLWEAESKDGGKTWGTARPSKLRHTSSRVFVTKLASGSLLAVKNGGPYSDEGRRNMTACLSRDEGRSWGASVCLDAERPGTSYPDGQQLADGRIVIVYDRDRLGAREVLSATFGEDDVRYGQLLSSGAKLLECVHRGDTFEWHDGAKLPQEGRAWSDTETPYVRLPDHLKGKVPPAVWGLSRQSSGICYRFTTDSRKIRVKWDVGDRALSGHNMTGAGKSGVDVYGWDEAKGWQFVRGSRPKQPFNEIEFSWSPNRPCMIYLPLYNRVTRFEVGVLKGSAVKPLPVRANGIVKPVVCYGTSITHGASASRPGLAWTAQAARYADVPFVDLGFAGSGKMEPSMLEAVSEIDASLYVLDCLWNMGLDLVKERFEPFVRELRRRRPQTPILCAEDCTTFRDRSEKGLFVEGVVAKLKAEDPKLWAKLHFISNEEQMVRDGEETVDGCHPNDRGMKTMGEGFGRKYREILGAGPHGRFVDASPADPRYLATGDGKTWLPIGCNICFDRLEKPSAEARALFDGWMTKFAANGGDFMRVWLSTPFVEVMPEKAGEFSAEATDNLKWLVARAEQLGIRLKFTFENFRRLAPERKDRDPAKGIVSFTRPAYLPYAKTMREFFTSDECLRLYAARARHVAEAVGNSPALVAVEFWNEINSTGASLDVLAAWTDRMMPELQRLFPRQMVVQNLGSFSSPEGGRHYDWLAGIRGNGFLQAHRYLDLGGQLDVVRGPVDVFCADAIRELRDRRADLPVFLSEVGAVEPNHTGPSRFYALDKAGALLHDEIFAPFFAGSAGSGQPWHWDHQYIDGMNLWHHFARFATAVKGLDPAAERFAPFHTETARLRVWGLRGRQTTVCWCRDKRNGWHDEFVDGRAPETLSGEKLPFSSATGFDVYLPFEDRSAKAKAGRCVLPPFARSCVVRFPAQAK